MLPVVLLLTLKQTMVPLVHQLTDSHQWPLVSQVHTSYHKIPKERQTLERTLLCTPDRVLSGPAVSGRISSGSATYVGWNGDLPALRPYTEQQMFFNLSASAYGVKAVSYTHLTLPTTG